MALNFDNEIPEWKNEGVQPSEELREKGFTGGYKPPATVFNWFWCKVQKCIIELQSKLKTHAELMQKALDIMFKSQDLKITEETNFNDITLSGCYQVHIDKWGDSNLNHSPNEYSQSLYTYGLLIVFKSALSSSRVLQIYLPASTTDSQQGINLTRICATNGTWNKWTPISKGHTHNALNINVGNTMVIYDGSAAKTVNIAVDTAPINGSNNLITSSGVYNAINASGSTNNIHRLKVSIDGNYSSGGSAAIIINNIKKLSSSTEYETGDIVFVTFVMEETTITENSDYNILLKDDVFYGHIGAMAIYFIDNAEVSNMTAGMLPKNKNAVFTIMCTLRKLSGTQVCLYVYK